MYDANMGKLKTPLVYFSVREEEFWDAALYTMGLAEASQTLVNVMSYVRRRMGGMSLVTKELMAPWDLPKRDVHAFCLAVTAYVWMNSRYVNQLADPDNYQFAGLIKKLCGKIKNGTRTFLNDHFQLMFALLCSRRMQEDLIQFPETQLVQEGTVWKRLHCGYGETQKERLSNFFLGVPRGTIDVGLTLDHPNEADLPSCALCYELYGQLGEQKIVCTPSEDTTHVLVFSLDEAQLGALKTSLMDNDKDPAGLAKVKDRACKCMPKAPFSRRAKVRYIRAGPGCGKSYIIRKLADEED